MLAHATPQLLACRDFALQAVQMDGRALESRPENKDRPRGHTLAAFKWT